MALALRFGGRRVRAGRGVGVRAVSRERDGAEGETVPVGSVGDVRARGPSGLASARGRPDGQYGQLPVDQGALARPGAQGLDDVGDMIGARVRLAVSPPRA